MTTFSDSAQLQLGNDDTRQKAWDHFVAVGLPTTSDEVWRYAPLRDFTLDKYSNFDATNGGALSPRASELLLGPSILIVNGVVKNSNLPEGVSVE